MRIVSCCSWQVDVGEEAVVEIGAFDDEVCEEVVSVPQKEVLVVARDVVR